MRTLEDIWPLFGLRITAGPLELRPVADADIPGLVALAEEGIHPADRTTWPGVPVRASRARPGRTCSAGRRGPTRARSR